ncbi:hypothetical protein ACLMJK_008668 [Lecanora helva]
MDGLSTAASVAGIAAIGVQLSKNLYSVITTINAGKEETRDLANNVSLLAIVLKELQEVLDSDEIHFRPLLEENAHTIATRCEKIFEEIGKHTCGKNGRPTSKLLWYFKRERVKYLRVSLESLKSTLNVFLHVAQLTIMTQEAENSRSKASNDWIIRRERRGVAYDVVENRVSVSRLKVLEEEEEEAVPGAFPHAYETNGALSTAAMILEIIPHHEADQIILPTNKLSEPDVLLAKAEKTMGTLLLKWTYVLPESSSELSADATGICFKDTCGLVSGGIAGMLDIDCAAIDNKGQNHARRSVRGQTSSVPPPEHEFATDSAEQDDDCISTSSRTPAAASGGNDDEEQPLAAQNRSFEDTSALDDWESSSINKIRHTNAKTLRWEEPITSGDPDSEGETDASRNSSAKRNNEMIGKDKGKRAEDIAIHAVSDSTPNLVPELGAGDHDQRRGKLAQASKSHLLDLRSNENDDSSTIGIVAEKHSMQNHTSDTEPSTEGAARRREKATKHKAHDRRSKSVMQSTRQDGVEHPFNSKSSYHRHSQEPHPSYSFQGYSIPPQPQYTYASSRVDNNSFTETSLGTIERILEIVERPILAMGKLEAEHRQLQEDVKVKAVMELSKQQATAANKAEQNSRPIILQDCLERRFVFPLEMCRTWFDLEGLIRRRFTPHDPVGLKVFKKEYDILSPTGEIILPETWELLLQPGWTIGMRLRPTQEDGRVNHFPEYGSRFTPTSLSGSLQPPSPPGPISSVPDSVNTGKKSSFKAWLNSRKLSRSASYA